MNSEVLAAFPWIAWYIWKARNEKVFKDKDISPMDTLQLAVKESESWRLAQRIDTEQDRDVMEQQRTENRVLQEPYAGRWRCQTDASWINANDRTGLGFVLLDGGNPVLFGAQGTRSAATSLHAELVGLYVVTTTYTLLFSRKGSES